MENQYILDILKNNSNSKLNESITASDVADSDEIISKIIDQKFIDSLAYQICDVQPIHGPTGGAFAVKANYKAEVAEVPAVAQVETATPVAADSTLYTLTINGIDFSFTSGVGATVAQITAGLVNEINIVETNGSVPVTAVDNTTSITLTADVAGTAFTVTSTGVGTIGIVNDTPNTPFSALIPASNDIKVVRNNVTVEDDAVAKGGLTLEAIQDLQNQFGKDAIGFISKAYSGISASNENAKLLTKIATWAVDDSALSLTAPTNAETTVFEVSKKVAENVLKINAKNYRTLDAWAILPQSAAGAFLGLSTYFTDSRDESGLMIGKAGRIKYYVNPDPAATVAYVGLNGKNPGSSSVIMSPYQHQLITAVDPDSGNTNVFIINRYAMTLSPLSETDNEMIRSFTIA